MVTKEGIFAIMAMHIREGIMGFYAYKLSEATRDKLLGKNGEQTIVPAKYAEVVADHITYKLAKEGEPMPAVKKAEVIGVADDGNGLQALVTRINGSLERPDGKIFHVT